MIRRARGSRPGSARCWISVVAMTRQHSQHLRQADDRGGVDPRAGDGDRRHPRRSEDGAVIKALKRCRAEISVGERPSGARRGRARARAGGRFTRPAGTPGDDRLGRHVLDIGRVDRFLCSGRHEHLHAVEAVADGTSPSMFGAERLGIMGKTDRAEQIT